jgi:tetratricopeptide (TPR) repeat protein
MDPNLARQVEDAYRKVLEQPSDLSLWSAYARLQVQGGNYEGGIGALERLMLQPNYPPELPLEIGVLYFRLGSYAQAAAMAEQALADSRLPPEQRELAQRLLSDATARTRASQLTGNAVFGIRHQTNPGYRTYESQVFSGGVLGPVAPDQQPHADLDATAGVRLQHLYDLDLQNSGAISTNFGAYVVDYRDSKGSTLVANPTRPYDLVMLDLNVGFEFKPAPGSLPGLTLRPFAAFGNVEAQQHGYMRTQGAGLDAFYRIDERTLVDGTAGVQRRDFEQRIDLLNAAYVSGDLTSLRGRVVREMAPGHVLTGEAALRRNSTYRTWFDYDQQELRVAYDRSYASPVAASRGAWTTSAWLGYMHRGYDAADPTVSASTVRKDDEWRIGLSQTIPLAEKWFLLGSLEQANNRSSLPNFRYRNTSVSASVLRTF